MRPCYLPREFSHVLVIAVYIPPSANATTACDRLHSVTGKLQTQHPQALILISGDFNHAPPSSTLPTFTQYVSCHTRDNKTLDLFYANTKEAYSSSPLPPLGASDHNLVYLRPVYKPLVQRKPAVTRSVRRWSGEVEGALRDCFDSTMWENFCGTHGGDIDSLTNCITDYINFCVENIVPTRTVQCFSNNKPWINPGIKALLKEKKRAFRSGNREELKVVQKELRRKIREGKDCYRRKVEDELQRKNISGVWRDLKTISGHKEPSFQAVGDQKWVNDLNLFFNRFDQSSAHHPTQSPLPHPPVSLPPSTLPSCPLPLLPHPSSSQPPCPLLPPPPSSQPPCPLLPAVSPPAPSCPLLPAVSPPAPPCHHCPTLCPYPRVLCHPAPSPSCHILPAVSPPAPAPSCPSHPALSHPHSCPPPAGSSLSLSTLQVRNQLRRIRVRKAAGPDAISSRLLKSCADQLCGILTYIYNRSLELGKVPRLWKTSCVVPVPKTPNPKELNNYRPVVLTSHLMKTLERLVLRHLRPLVSPSMDPLQFAYQPGIGVDDAVILLLHRTLHHLEKPGNTVRIMFFDFSSAFNTIQPALLRDKLELTGVNPHLSAWILDYLTNRPQYVRAQNCVSDTVVCSTGAPQGTVLAPFLFTLYTADFRYNNPSCFLQKFSDDSVIVGLITGDDDREYLRLNQDFVAWCQRNHLQLNTGKTKEMVVDFRRPGPPPPTSVNIQGTDIERVSSYKYLGVHLNNKLDWSDNTAALYKKGQSRLYLLRRLRSFGVQGALLKTFFDTVVASALFYGVVCWGSSISATERRRLDKLIRRASSVLGCPLDSVEVVGERRVRGKLSSLMRNSSHPLHGEVTALESSLNTDRLIHPKCVRERYRKSFLPAAVRLYNKDSTNH